MNNEMRQIETNIKKLQYNRRFFSEFLEAKMDEFDFSNTTLSKEVLHGTEDKISKTITYSPVTRQAIGAWLKGTIPSSRDIYISLGMAFHMEINQINKELLEVYMGTGLYCKNVEDAIWIAVVKRLFPMSEIPYVKEEIELLINSEEEQGLEYSDGRSIPTTDLWVELAYTKTKEEFLEIIKTHKSEFLDGARKFGQCMEEVIEEEYGYYEKTSEFLENIGLSHCEAQFSKIKAGKAIVTREWLLRFCIALQPSIQSIQKLFDKAQMEPLGITPVELVIKEVAKSKSSLVSNSHEIWVSIEETCNELKNMGYNMEEELGKKYYAALMLPLDQKIFFGILVGQSLLHHHKTNDFGYVQEKYCRYQYVDRLLYGELNRFKKNASFKNTAKELVRFKDVDLNQLANQYPIECFEQKEVDEVNLERFEAYCFCFHPQKGESVYYMNDIYFYSAFLYSLFLGRCFTKDFDSNKQAYVSEQYHQAPELKELLLYIFEHNLGQDIQEEKILSINQIIELLKGKSQ